MAIYDFDPNRFGINFLGPGIAGGTAGVLSGLLQRQDPRNIEIRRTWADPSRHMTPFGFAPGTPNQVVKDFEVVGGFIQATDSSGKPIINPATGQPVVKWDQRYQKKGSPIPEGYQVLSDPYSQFPGAPEKVEAAPKVSPLPIGGWAGMPNILSPLRMKSGGEVKEQSPLQALITLLEIEHQKTKKGEVPAILHKGEGVVTKKGMKVLDNMVGGIDNLNSLGENLPKMERGGEVGDNNKPDTTWTMVRDTEGRIIWLPAQKPERTGPVEGITPFNEPKKSQTVVPPKDGALMQGNDGLYWKRYNPYPTQVGGEKGKQPPKEPQKTGAKPTVPVTNVEMTPPSRKVTPAKPGYRDWNAPSQFSFGQLQSLDPLQAMGIIQADVESRGVPPLQPVYGVQGQVLPQQSIAGQRTARQGEITNQYLAGLQGEAAKTQMDWYPKEAKAKIDQINSQIAYNNEMLKRATSAGGMSPDDMLKLAKIDKINSELSINKISALESALKSSDKMDEKSKQLLALEYIMTKYPSLTEIKPNELIDYLKKGNINIFGIRIPGTAKISEQDIALVANRVSGTGPIMSNQSGGLSQIMGEYQIPNNTPSLPSAPGASPVTTNLMNMQNALIGSGVIK